MIEIKIIEQQLNLLSDKPEELNKVYDIVRLAVEKSKRFGLSEKEYKRRLNKKLKEVGKLKIFR